MFTIRQHKELCWYANVMNLTSTPVWRLTNSLEIVNACCWSLDGEKKYWADHTTNFFKNPDADKISFTKTSVSYVIRKVPTLFPITLTAGQIHNRQTDRQMNKRKGASRQTVRVKTLPLWKGQSILMNGLVFFERDTNQWETLSDFASLKWPEPPLYVHLCYVIIFRNIRQHGVNCYHLQHLTHKSKTPDQF